MNSNEAQRRLIDDGSDMLALGDGLFCFRAMADAAALSQNVEGVIARAPWRHMQVRGGGRMAAAMSNCGSLGWVSDVRGYRYTAVDPMTAKPWPPMPSSFARLATELAARAGFVRFEPDACLLNRYAAGAGLGLHQDRDEADFSYPIVSVSLGAAARFLWGGPRRADPVRMLQLHDGDVLVWGGPSRLHFHGVAPLDPPTAGDCRLNLTLRRAGSSP